MRSYYVYIMTNRSGTLYVGVTNNLVRRAYEHREHLTPGFTDKYNMDRLIYFEETTDVLAALEREKQIKRWRQEKKINLIESVNPEWETIVAY